MLNTKEPQPADNAAATKVEYSMSAGFAARLAKANIAIALTSYQSNLLYMLGSSPKGGLHVHQSVMPKPMGLHLDDRKGLLVACGSQIIEFADVLSAGQVANGVFDTCFIPRRISVTGILDAHDVARLASGEIAFVNTRYNCIARPHAVHSFEQIWRPSFIDALVDEDRCHLNGLAIKDDGQLAYATAVSRSNTIDGWRDRRDGGGIVIDISRDEIIATGLAMPHSPRWHRGQLWVLNSGSGELGRVRLDADLDPAARFTPVAFCPGFLRGLGFHEDLAFVGLSKPRYKRFEGLPLDAKLKASDSEPWCGIQVIDTKTGVCVDWFRIDGDIMELYDLTVLPNTRCAMAASPGTPEVARMVTLPNSAPEA